MPQATSELERFFRKVFKMVGMSPTRTYAPPWINPQHTPKPCKDMDHAHKEFLVTVLGPAQELLAKTGTSLSKSSNSQGTLASHRVCRTGIIWCVGYLGSTGTILIPYNRSLF
jgi:hypothetical protein